MTSTQKIKTNCANAQTSTGPKTRKGKGRAAQNARRHGLSLPIVSDPALSKQVESLAQEIVGEVKDRNIYERARRIAEAQIDINRIWHARHDLVACSINDSECGTSGPPVKDVVLPGAQKRAVIPREMAKQLALLDRYWRRALSRRKFAIRAFDRARQQVSEIDASPPAATDKT